MTTTANYGWYKPSKTDNTVEVVPSLATLIDQIDAEVKERETEISLHKTAGNAHTSDGITHADGSVKTTLDNHTTRIVDLENAATSYTNVLSFGAVGDGVADDTAAFNAAISSLVNGGVVFVPYGKTYMIQGWAADSAPDFPTGGVKLKDNVTIMMYGAVLKVIANDKDHYTCINVSDCNNVKVIGGKLIGERSTHVNSPTYADYGDQWGYGVAVVGSSDVIIEDVRADDFMGDGFYIGANTLGVLSANVTVKDCIAHNNRRNGMSVTGLYTGTIENNVFRETNGHLPEAGLDIEPNPGRTVDGVLIRGNKFLGNNSFGLLFGSINSLTRSGQNCVVTGNVSRYNKGTGIYINRGYNNVIENNQVFENDENGIGLIESHYNVVNNNKAYLNKMHGFLIGYAEGNNIEGNSSVSNGQGANQTYDQYTLYGALRNNIQGNSARHESRAIKARYGMYLTSDCEDNLVMNNDFATSAFFAGLNNASSRTLKGAGNRGNAYTSWSTGDFI